MNNLELVLKVLLRQVQKQEQVLHQNISTIQETTLVWTREISPFFQGSSSITNPTIKKYHVKRKQHSVVLNNALFNTILSRFRAFGTLQNAKYHVYAKYKSVVNLKVV